MSPELFFAYFDESLQGISAHFRRIFQFEGKKVYRYTGSITLAMRAAVEQMLSRSQGGITRKLFLESRALELLSHQLEQVSAPVASAIHVKRMHPVDRRQTQRARDFLVDNLESPVSLAELSKKAGMSSPKLNRCFKQMYGMTVFAYLRTERLNLAIDLLENTGISITETAYRVGYDSPSHFSKAFKKRFGNSPRIFRSAS